MSITKKVYVDPPSGHLYGFPAVYDPTVDGSDLRAWMIKTGYPERETEFAMKYLRLWDYPEEIEDDQEDDSENTTSDE